MDYIRKYWHILIYLIITVVLFQQFIFSNDALFSSDQLQSGIFFRKMYSDFVSNFWTIPIWDRYISGGLPFVGAMHGDTFYPAAILQFFISMHRALGLKLVIHIFLAGIFMYTFLKNYGLNKISAFVGGLAYMLSPMIVTLVYPGHDAKIYVAALLPLAFNYLYKALKGNEFKNFVYFGTTVGFMILSSHVQSTYFAMWILFFYTVYFLINESFLEKKPLVSTKKFGKFWFAIFFAVIIGAVQLIPPYIYSKSFSIRGTETKKSFEHACSWGMHPEEAVSLVVPEFCGDNRSSHIQTQQEYNKFKKEGGNSYWGRNPFKLNSEYMGIPVIIMSLLALFVYRGKRRKDIYFFLGFGLFTILYSLVNHTPLFYLVYKIIPGVNLFRGQGMILFILSFCLTVTSAIFIDSFDFVKYKEEIPKRSKKILIFSIVITALFLSSFLFFDSFMQLFTEIFKSGKQPSAEYLPFIKRGFLISGILASVLSFSFFFVSKSKEKYLYLIAIISILIILDSFRVDMKFIKAVDINKLGIKFKPDNLVKQLQSQYDAGNEFRVFNLPGREYYEFNQLPIHKIETVRGFHDNELKWYRQYRGINKAGVNTDRNLMKNNSKTGFDNNLVNIAAAKYILFKNEDKSLGVMPNKNYMQKAYTVSNYEVIANQDDKGVDAIVNRMQDTTFNYRNTIILEEEPKEKPVIGETNPGFVSNYKWQKNNLFVNVKMERDGFLFISDNYFPYWHAFDEANNDKEIKIYKADLTFRALFLKKGEHKIRFDYISIPFIVGKYLTLAGLLFAFLIMFLNKKKRKL